MKYWQPSNLFCQADKLRGIVTLLSCVLLDLKLFQNRIIINSDLWEMKNTGLRFSKTRAMQDREGIWYLILRKKSAFTSKRKPLNIIPQFFTILNILSLRFALTFFSYGNAQIKRITITPIRITKYLQIQR